MELTKLSALTNEEHTLNLPISEEEFNKCFRLWKNEGECIQDAFPSLTDEEREFIMDGTLETEFKHLII